MLQSKMMLIYFEQNSDLILSLELWLIFYCDKNDAREKMYQIYILTICSDY